MTDFKKLQALNGQEKVGRIKKYIEVEKESFKEAEEIGAYLLQWKIGNNIGILEKMLVDTGIKINKNNT